jgi:hypothetical protein
VEDPEDDLGPFMLFVRTYCFGFLIPILSFLIVYGLNTKALSQLGVALGNATVFWYVAFLMIMLGRVSDQEQVTCGILFIVFV